MAEKYHEAMRALRKTSAICFKKTHELMCASKKKNWLYLWLVLSFSYNVVGWSDLPGREFFHSLLLSHAHLIIKKKNKKGGTYDKLMYLQLITLSQLLVSLFLQFLQWHSDVVCLNLLYGIYRVFVSHIEWKLLLFRGIFFFGLSFTFFSWPFLKWVSFTKGAPPRAYVFSDIIGQLSNVTRFRVVLHLFQAFCIFFFDLLEVIVSCCSKNCLFFPL